MSTLQTHQTEPNANNALGALLRRMLPGYAVRYEQTQTLVEHFGRHPDILITAAGRSPVVVEAEYEPGPEAEQDARERLGLAVTGEPRTIEAAIALRYPRAIENAYDLDAAISDARMFYCVFYESGARFPESGWLNGSATDLADLIRLVSVPQRAVEDAAAALEQGIERAVSILNHMAQLRPNITPDIARRLGMSDVPQTRRMACAIIANALVFHQRIAGMHAGVKPLNLICGPGVANPQSVTLEAWSNILQINYWAIFAIAKDILEQLPAGDAARILAELRDTAQQIDAAGVDNAHDLTGRIFQRLIADRKYLATFYTLPASAALLARLAVSKLRGVDWNDAEAVGQLRIADFACGTGALLSAVYEQVAARHSQTGGDPEQLHTAMMQEVLYGCDVMPSAVHITGSTLSGIVPAALFDNSRLYTLAYGRQKDGDVRIGSLELLQSSAAMTLFNTSDPALRTGSVGEETAAQIIADIPDGRFDLVIMNPPFTSNTKHRDADGNVQNAAFASFGAPIADQDDMSARLTRFAQHSCYHGHAGLGAAFAAIADKKVRPGGVIALLILFTAVNGASWAKFRRLIAEKYTDVTIVSVAANGTDMSFSSDTGVAECLVIGRRLVKGEKSSGRARFTSLRRRPRSFAEAREIAAAIADNDAMRCIEDGPYGGIPIYTGDTLAGEILDAPLDDHDNGWGAGRLLDASLAQVAYSLVAGNILLPAEPQAWSLPMTHLREIGQLGVHDSLLTMTTHGGPFIKMAPSPTATYPALYNHHARRETRLICKPDAQLRVRPGGESRAAELWSTASRAHLNRDFTFGSQALAVAFTELASLGGTVWPNIGFDDHRFDYAFTVWGNSTLGLLSYWWHSSRQQSSKARMTRLVIPNLPTLNLRALSDDQLSTAQAVFDDFRDKELQPAYLADADPNRALLDRRVLCDLLGFDDAVYQGVRRLAAKWCAEPSVHGGKRRPKGAHLVI